MRLAAAGILLLFAALTGCAPPPGPPASDLVSRAVERTTALQSVHFTLDVARGFVLLGPSLQVTKAEGDVARPDRLRVRATARLGGVVIETEMIHVEGESYLLNPFSARWERLAGGLAPVPLLDPDRGVARVMRAVSNPRVEGEETVAGGRAWRVRGTVGTSDVTALLGGVPVDGRVDAEALVDNDGLVHRLILRGAIVQGELPETARRLDFSRFDAAPQVERPPAP